MKATEYILDHILHYIVWAQNTGMALITLNRNFNTSSLSQIRSHLIPFPNAQRRLEKHTDTVVHCMGKKASTHNRFLDVVCLQPLPTGFLTLHSNQSIKTQADLHLERKIPRTGYHLTSRHAQIVAP